VDKYSKAARDPDGSTAIQYTTLLLDATERLWPQNVLTFPQPFRILSQGSSCVLQMSLSFECITFIHGSQNADLGSSG